jgi:UDP-glucose 4-epimerase
MHTKTILVVGGAGYIGSHMVLCLRRAGYQPVVVDNLHKGHREAVLGAELIVGDIADTDFLADVFSRYQFSAVMHFASLIEVGESVKFPARYYQNNVTATLNLLAVMLANQVKHFIFSSTAAVYGEPKSRIISENHMLAPINPYGRSKWMVEEMIKDLSRSDDLSYAILRYFNAAGADPEGNIGECHEPESHLIPIVLEVAAGKRKEVIINGDQYPTADGTCVRDYVHVTDICNAHLLALQAMFKGRRSLTCNIGTGQGHSILQVLQAARRVTGHPVPAVKGASRAGDPAILVADPALIQQELQWKARYPDLDTIIKHAWQFMQKKKVAA